MNNILISATMHAAAVGVLACLISESILLAPVRNKINWSLFYCPICLGFWLAAPSLCLGLWYYFLVIAISNAWMLVILKVYESLETGENNE